MDKHAAFEIAVRKGWLSQTPDSFQHAVLERCLLERFETGTPIYSIGDEPGGMYGMFQEALPYQWRLGRWGPTLRILRCRVSGSEKRPPLRASLEGLA